jgi:thiol-disulfide isomerase/thioredoxin
MFENSSVIKAPEFPQNFDWINTDEPLLLSKLKGSVVVLDFWTYCCINCMHTLPVLAALEEKYKDKPVVFIGVHSAKFFSEQDARNVQSAVARYEIHHPVIVDREMQIWQSFGVNAWPTIVVIDPNGTMVYKQSGEGQRDVLEDVLDTLISKHSQKGTLAKEPPSIRYSMPVSKHILSFPGKLAISRDGKIAISDSNHNRILVTDISGKLLHTIGSGKAGLQDGGFDSARFFRPQGVAWNNNELYVADTENHAIRKLSFEKNNIVTIAGTGLQGQWALGGGRGTSVSISSPWDVACKDNHVFIAMAGTHQIWTYDTKTELVLPFAGSGHENIIDGPVMEAQLAQTSGLGIFGNKLYFADSETSSIRQVNLEQKQVKTIVGRGLFEFGYRDGNANSALFQHPLGLCVADGTIFVADTYNSAIRVIDLKNSQVYTLVGKTQKNLVCLPDNPECNILPLYESADVELYENKLYIADTNNHLIRVFDLNTNSLQILDVRN